MNANALFEQLIAKQDLSPEQMQQVLNDCMSGRFSDSQIASFLALMRMKGESSAELSAAAQLMQNLAHNLDLDVAAIDIVGTGGDGKNTFNVSTACAFVVAASGIPVAKHGNRSVSSRSGSADLLEQAGFVLTGSDADMKQCVQQCNLAFLFAPHYHPAMQKVRTARQQLGIRTLFNLLGPLINPAKVKRQVVGVFSQSWLQPLSSVLINLGSQRHLVLSSEDGLDEISIAADTQVLEYNNGKSMRFTIKPKDYGFRHDNLDAIVVSSPAQSLTIIKNLLAGAHGAARDIVVLNAAAAIYCAKDEEPYDKALVTAQNTIDSGKALELFERLRHLTQTFTQD